MADVVEILTYVNILDVPKKSEWFSEKVGNYYSQEKSESTIPRKSRNALEY